MRLGFLYLALLTFVSCQEGAEELKNYKEYDGPWLEMEDVVTLYSDSAVVQIRIEAPVQMEYVNGDRELPKGVYIEFYDLDGSISSTLSANHAYYNKEKHEWKAVGEVVVNGVKKNEVLNTEELFWKPDEQRVYTDKFVTIERQDEILMGQGMDAKQDFSEYKLRRVTGEIPMERVQ